MKTSKKFNVGDKVFAKVKGYPPWPAKVMENHGKKCNVRFYGTGETGTIKVEDMFYYINNKAKFLKPLKRKDYKDAIEEIETDIIEDGGTDGSTGANDADESKNSIPDTSIDTEPKKPGKRTFSNASEKLDDEVLKKKTRRSSNVSSSTLTDDGDVVEVVEKEIVKTASSTENSKRVSEKEEDPLELAKEIDHISIHESDTESDIEKGKTSEENGSTSSINGVTPKFDFTTVNQLNNIINYTNHVRNHEDLYKDKPVEPRNNADEVLAVKLPSGKYVAIKCAVESPPNCESEFQMAEHEAAAVKRILDLKKSLEEGTAKVEDHLDLCVPNLNVTEEDITDALKRKYLTWKQVKFEWLRIETRLLALDAKIRAALGLDKAFPKQALDCLGLLLELPIEPLMLRKHPHVVDMIKRLRRYMGNVKEWNLPEEEMEVFLDDAASIRDKAEEVYDKFREICKIEDKNFWDAFNETVEEFKKHIQNLTENQVFSLRFEPNSREAFMDQTEDDIRPEEVEKNKSLLKNEQNVENSKDEMVKSEQLESVNDSTSSL